jgi:four helix bundle protein
MPERKRNATDKTKATDAAHPLPQSHSSPQEGFIPPHGGYEKLLSYPKSQIIYDATVRFCDRFIDKKSRTHDQMVQAARSGNKNIAEGSRISGTSKEAELKLTNVARASLEELLGDYKDYLRQRGHALWDKNSKEAIYVRRLGKKDDLSYEDFREFIDTRPAERRFPPGVRACARGVGLPSRVGGDAGGTYHAGTIARAGAAAGGFCF